MLSLILSALTTFAGAETITIKPLIASRANQSAIVLIEANQSASFAICPFTPDVGNGTIGLDASRVPSDCRRVGRRLISAEEVARALQTYASLIAKLSDATSKFGNSHPGKQFAYELAAGVTTGYAALVGFNMGRLSPAGQLRLKRILKVAPREAFFAGLIGTAWFAAIDQALIRSVRREAPAARYVASHATNLGQSEVIILEDGPGARTAFSDLTRLLRTSVRNLDFRVVQPNP